jgi:hypothetical protein
MSSSFGWSLPSASLPLPESRRLGLPESLLDRLGLPESLPEPFLADDFFLRRPMTLPESLPDSDSGRLLQKEARTNFGQRVGKFQVLFDSRNS